MDKKACPNLIIHLRVFVAQLKHVDCKTIVLGDETREYDENPKCTYFEQYDQIIPLHMYTPQILPYACN